MAPLAFSRSRQVIEEQMKKAVLTSKGTLQTELDGHYSSGYDACDASLSTSQASRSADSGFC